MIHKQLILEYSKDKDKLNKIRMELSHKNGKFFNDSVMFNKEIEEFLGDGYEKTISISRNLLDDKLSLQDITALGGWCAVRTKCLTLMSQGILMGPMGDVWDYSLENLHTLLQECVGGDQIIDSVGFYNGDKYALISEQFLWSRKVISAYFQATGKVLNKLEQQKIVDSIGIGENKRYLATKKYLEFIKQRKIDLVKFTDLEIWDDLVAARDALLKEISIDMQDLVRPFVENRLNKSHKNDIFVLNDMEKFVSDYSLVWTMYTGKYLEILKKRGIIDTNNALIIEPWTHARSNEGQIALNEYIAKSSPYNLYMDNRGINKNLGFVSIIESSLYNFKSTRVFKLINEIPNNKNYESFIGLLNDDPAISNLDLSQNPTFLLTANYLPYGKAKELLLQMIIISTEFKNRRLKIKQNNVDAYDHSTLNQKDVSILRKNKSSELKSISLKLNDMLFQMFNYIYS